MVKFNLSLTKLALELVFFGGLFMGILGVSEAYGAYISTEHHIPEPVSMLLFGLGLVWIAGFGRKKSIKK